jgi:hypothetical protein
MISAIRTTIYCKGTVPGTSDLCGVGICDTDGERFFLNVLGSDLILELNPPTVRCDLCGYKTRLTFKGRLQSSLHSKE